jgi:ubiquinol-cytochrome c reductase cytochrome c1 subunit
MVRPIGMLAGAGFVLALLWSLAWNVIAYVEEPPVPSVEHEFHLKPKENVSWSFEGVGGKYDLAQLQRGFKVYKEVCSACHSMKLVAFRDLEEIGYSKAQVKQIAKDWVVEVPSVNPETGEPATRKALPFDKFPSPYANETAARASNNNALPPDQSLIAKAREGGPHYIYSLLTGYTDQAGYKNAEGKELLKEFPDAKTPDGLHFNPYFPNLNLAMAPPLADGAVTFDDGSKNDVKAMAKDVSAFLMWAAEPNLPTRHAVGWATLAYLLAFTALTYLAYRNIWADKKPKKQ